MSDEELRIAKGRLVKLWDAYETLEKENKNNQSRLKELEEKVREKERILSTLRELLDTRDTESRKLEIQKTSLQNQLEDVKARLEESTIALEKERGRYKKLYLITEEMELETEELKKGIEERDRWFRENLESLSEISTIIKLRNDISQKTRINRVTDYELERVRPGARDISLDDIKAETVEESETTFQRVDEKEEGKKELMDLPGLDNEKAEILIKAGYSSIEKLKHVSPFELVKLDGITPTVARKISEHVKAL